MAHLDFERPLVELEQRIGELEALAEGEGLAMDGQLADLRARAVELRQDLYQGLSIWQKVQLSRHPDRPYFNDYLERIFEDFVELHGDRLYRDDPSIVAGFARLDGETVAVIGQQKGRTTRQKVMRNFGMAHPEGYRKAMRVMELADRYRRPIFTFIDTPGAYPGIGAEERGQAEAIGRSLLVMSQLGVPVVATVLGEGGSGGALALGVANRVLMFEFSTYSVITPEGCASILWRDGARGAEAAAQLGLLSSKARELEIVDRVLPEPLGGAQRDAQAAADILGAALREELRELSKLDAAALREHRYARFRRLGRFLEA
ncbi:MAG: acetyl-CoA carboxylase carboxyltransferase subunit alpha [Deltaproteobacteria bacterium]|nr:acetyl-CoA carboxylase carboxyltransferase subunit alpha [Deltaproteobacteria bacterium]